MTSSVSEIPAVTDAEVMFMIAKDSLRFSI